MTFHAVTAKPKLAISRLVLRPFFSKEHGFAVNIPGNFVPDQFPSTSSSSNGELIKNLEGAGKTHSFSSSDKGFCSMCTQREISLARQATHHVSCFVARSITVFTSFLVSTA